MRLQIAATAVALLLIIALVQCQDDDCVDEGVGYSGQEVRPQESLLLLPPPDQESCKGSCKQENACKYWTWKKQTKECTLFSTKEKVLQFKEVDESFELGDVASGPKVCTGNVPFTCQKSQTDIFWSTMVFKSLFISSSV